jgi:hypothetical protein
MTNPTMRTASAATGQSMAHLSTPKRSSTIPGTSCGAVRGRRPTSAWRPSSPGVEARSVSFRRSCHSRRLSQSDAIAQHECPGRVTPIDGNRNGGEDASASFKRWTGTLLLKMHSSLPRAGNLPGSRLLPGRWSSRREGPPSSRIHHACTATWGRTLLRSFRLERSALEPPPFSSCVPGRNSPAKSAGRWTTHPSCKRIMFCTARARRNPCLSSLLSFPPRQGGGQGTPSPRRARARRRAEASIPDAAVQKQTTVKSPKCLVQPQNGPSWVSVASSKVRVPARPATVIRLGRGRPDLGSNY